MYGDLEAVRSVSLEKYYSKTAVRVLRKTGISHVFRSLLSFAWPDSHRAHILKSDTRMQCKSISST
jgi:hypothetical protein